MNDATEIVVDDAYEEIAATYQCLEIERLNDVLLRNGISDKEVRKAICGEYQASVGALRDQFWFDVGGTKVHPVVVFSTKFTGDSAEPKALGKIYWKTPAFAFTEYAYGDATHFFDEQGESLKDVVSGSVYL